MKKYVTVCVYTENKRGAAGYASDIEMFDSLDKAKEFITKNFEQEKDFPWNKLEFIEQDILDCETMKKHKELRASYDDKHDGYCSWKIVEFDV